MRVYCIECNTPIEVDTSKINDSYIPPDLCSCDNCNQEKETDQGRKELEANFNTPEISHKELRKKEQEERRKNKLYKGIGGAYKICTKCNGEFQDIYDGICHLCWNKIYNDSDKKHQEFKTYRCPYCNRVLFKGNVRSLAIPCPKCNKFVKINIKIDK